MKVVKRDDERRRKRGKSYCLFYFLLLFLFFLDHNYSSLYRDFLFFLLFYIRSSFLLFFLFSVCVSVFLFLSLFLAFSLSFFSLCISFLYFSLPFPLRLPPLSLSLFPRFTLIPHFSYVSISLSFSCFLSLCLSPFHFLFSPPLPSIPFFFVYLSASFPFYYLVICTSFLSSCKFSDPLSSYHLNSYLYFFLPRSPPTFPISPSLSLIHSLLFPYFSIPCFSSFFTPFISSLLFPSSIPYHSLIFRPIFFFASSSLLFPSFIPYYSLIFQPNSFLLLPFSFPHSFPIIPLLIKPFFSSYLTPLLCPSLSDRSLKFSCKGFSEPNYMPYIRLCLFEYP